MEKIAFKVVNFSWWFCCIHSKKYFFYIYLR